MPSISWILFTERVVGRNSPRFNDVVNRPLRQLLELTGWDPDDPNFSGLDHFPDGIFTDQIHEQTAGSGISFENDVHFNTVNIDIDLSGGKTLDIDGGDVNITNGFFSAKLKDITVGNDSPFSGSNPDVPSSLYVAESGVLTCNSVDPADIRFLGLRTEQVNVSPSFVWTRHTIGNLPFISLDETVGAEMLMYYLAQVTQWFRPDTITPSLKYDDSVHKWTFFDPVLFTGETGWTAGSGGTLKGGLVAGTSTLTDTQKVVNSLVALLLANGLALP